MKRLVSILVCMFFLCLVSITEVSANELTDVKDNEISMNDIQNILFDYFEKNNLNYELNTPEYLEYLMSVLIEGKDEDLASHPNYDLILLYASEYVSVIDEQQVLTDPNSEVLETLDLSEFETMTVDEVKEENLLEEATLEKNLDMFREKNLMSISTTSTYDRTAAVKYARAWYNSRNSLYNKHTLDCTNFASQVVIAGGKKEKKPTPMPSGINATTSYWYSDRYSMPSYSYAYRESTSFIRVTDFYTYWAKTQATKSTTSKSTIISQANLGDIVQLKASSGGNWYHTMIVTKKANGTIYLSGHTNDTLDKNINSINAYGFRLIKF